MNISAIRLRNQLLNTPLSGSPECVVSAMGAMQAQDYTMVKWAIGNRLDGATEKVVEDALRSGAVVRTHILRPTWHIVAAQDLRWMLELTGLRVKKIILGYCKHINLDLHTLAKTDELIIRALEGGQHKTRQEMGEAIRRAGIENDNHQIAQMMAHAELGGIVCSGIPRGKIQTYTLVDEWIPNVIHLERDEALLKLTSRYFASHGPATIQDFVWWSGLGIVDARRGLELIKSDFVARNIGGSTYYTNRDFEELPLNDNLLLLLPAFDEYLVSYKNRVDVLSDSNLRKVITSNGIFRPVIVFDGQVVGTWKQQRQHTDLVEPCFFEKPNMQMMEAFEKTISQFRIYKTT